MIPPGTVCCILCRGMIAYRNNDTTRFTNHMNYEHGAYFDMEFLLAACLMDEEERKAVRNVMELKYKSQNKENGGSKSSPKKRPSSAVNSEEMNSSKIPRTEKEVQIKKEVSDEIRILPEDWNVSKSSEDAEKKENEEKVSFKCDGCEKSFVHRKALQTHQVKFGHLASPQPTAAAAHTPTQITKAPSPSEFSCKVPNCKYTGSKSKDLQSHVARMHKTVTPTPPVPATPPPTGAPTQNPPSSELFSNMARSWAKKKGTPKATPPKNQNKTLKVKKEPVDNGKNESLQENSENPTNESLDISSNASGSVVTDSSCDNIDTSLDESSSENRTVEDTTFVAIDSSSVNETENADEVNIGKSKYFKANPQTVSTLTEKSAAAEQFTVLDEKLPAGWKVKEILHEFKSGRKERKRNYLTPDLKILKTGLAVLEYMRLSGKYSAKEIMDYAKYLSVPVNRLEKYMELYL